MYEEIKDREKIAKQKTSDSIRKRNRVLKADKMDGRYRIEKTL